MRGVKLRRRRWTLGQAMVETALLAPVLLVLLLGGMQVAYLGYDAVSIDTAAREGARVAVENAQTALSFSGTTPSTYKCASNPANDANPICKAVANNAGLLNGQTFALVEIDTNVVVAQRPPSDAVPGDVAQMGSCSNNNDAQFAGTISPALILPVTDSLGDSTSSDGSGNFTLCMHGTGSTTQTVSIQVNGTDGGLTCSGSSTTSISKSGNQWTATPSSGTVDVACTTPTPTPGTSSTSSTSSATFSLPSFNFAPHSASDSCTEVPAAGTYVTVTVEYQASILVPLLNTLLADSGKSYKTMKAVVTMRVEPCTT